MGRTDEEHHGGDERAEAAGAMPEDEKADADDQESLDRLDDRLTKEHDRIANDAERLDEAAKPLGRIEIDPGEVLGAQATREMGRTSQMEEVNIDSRIERMDDEDNLPRSEYGLLVSGHYEPWLRDRTQCGGGSWLYGPRSDRRGSSANSDFHIRGVSSIARLAGCMLMRWSTSTR